LNTASQAPSTTATPEPISGEEAVMEHLESDGEDELLQHKGVVVQV